MSTIETVNVAAPGEGLRLVLPGRVNPAGAGVTWIGEGWKLFVKAPLMWIVALVIVFVAAVVMSLVPIIGSIVFQLLNAAITAGFVVACRSLERGGDFELEHLFAGFKPPHFWNLALIGLFFLIGGLILLGVFAIFAGLSVLTAFMTGSTGDVATAAAASGAAIMLGLLVMLALMVPLLAAYWFAPALVIMHGIGPWDAMKASFFACFRNFIAFLIYSIVMCVLAIIAAIPLGLGFLVWIPVAIASTYAAYRAIFTEEDAAAAPVAAKMA